MNKRELSSRVFRPPTELQSSDNMSTRSRQRTANHGLFIHQMKPWRLDEAPSLDEDEGIPEEQGSSGSAGKLPNQKQPSSRKQRHHESNSTTASRLLPPPSSTDGNTVASPNNSEVSVQKQRLRDLKRRTLELQMEKLKQRKRKRELALLNNDKIRRELHRRRKIAEQEEKAVLFLPEQQQEADERRIALLKQQQQEDLQADKPAPQKMTIKKRIRRKIRRRKVIKRRKPKKGESETETITTEEIQEEVLAVTEEIIMPGDENYNLPDQADKAESEDGYVEEVVGNTESDDDQYILELQDSNASFYDQTILEDSDGNILYSTDEEMLVGNISDDTDESSFVDELTEEEKQKLEEEAIQREHEEMLLLHAQRQAEEEEDLRWEQEELAREEEARKLANAEDFQFSRAATLQQMLESRPKLEPSKSKQKKKKPQHEESVLENPIGYRPPSLLALVNQAKLELRPKPPKEHTKSFVPIVGDAASIGRLVRLREFTIVASGKRDIEEFKKSKTDSSFADWESRHNKRGKNRRPLVSSAPSNVQVMVNEAAAEGKIRAVRKSDLSQKVVSGDKLVDIDKLGDRKHDGAKVFRTEHLIDYQVNLEKQGKTDWTPAYEENDYEELDEVKLPTNKQPTFRPQTTKKSSMEIREELSRGVAEGYWGRHYRLERPGATLQVTQGCACKYCSNASAWQTFAYQKKWADDRLPPPGEDASAEHTDPNTVGYISRLYLPQESESEEEEEATGELPATSGTSEEEQHLENSVGALVCQVIEQDPTETTATGTGTLTSEDTAIVSSDDMPTEHTDDEGPVDKCVDSTEATEGSPLENSSKSLAADDTNTATSETPDEFIVPVQDPFGDSHSSPVVATDNDGPERTLSSASKDSADSAVGEYRTLKKALSLDGFLDLEELQTADPESAQTTPASRGNAMAVSGTRKRQRSMFRTRRRQESSSRSLGNTKPKGKRGSRFFQWITKNSKGSSTSTKQEVLPKQTKHNLFEI